MKQIILLLTVSVISLSLPAQGNSQGKGRQNDKTESHGNPANTKGKEKDGNDNEELNDYNKKIWEGTGDNGKGSKPSKNQPAKVISSFQHDYPNAVNVYWTKYRGDWTATFGNGFFRSTAIYHANGERRDTRTPVTGNQLPRIVLDSIFKKRPDTKLEDIIKIEVPNVVKDIFRIKNIIQGKPQYFYYNSDGLAVKYDY